MFKKALFISLLTIASFIASPVMLASANHTADHTARQITDCGNRGGIWNATNNTCSEAASVPTSGSGCANFDESILGIPTWYKYLEPNADCEPIIDGVEDFATIGLAVLEAGMTLGGMVAVVMVFIGGFKYVLSQGEPDKAAGGRKTVINAMIGLVIVILATRVVSFIASSLG